MSAPPPYPGYPSAPGMFPYGATPAGSAPPKHLRGYRPLVAMWITLAVAIALFVIGGVVLATKSVGEVNDFQRITMSDGSGAIQVNRTGKWIGYYEAGDVTDKIARIPNIQVQILDPNGKPVTLQPYGNRSDNKINRMTYDYNSHRGAAAFQFEVSSKGTYDIRTRAIDSLPRDAALAFGPDIASGTIAGGLLIIAGVASLLAAVILLIVGLVRRSGHKRELQAATGFGMPAPGYPGAPPGYPGGAYPGQGVQGQGFPGQPGQGQGFPGQPGQSQAYPGPTYPGTGYPGPTTNYPPPPPS